MKKIVLSLLAVVGMVPVFAQEDLTVLNYWKFHKSQPHVLYSQLMSRTSEQLGERSAAVSQLKSRAEWTQRQKKIAGVLKGLAGAFPEKTPLNPVKTGTIERDGVRVEKLYFESRPGYYVTAALFMPAHPAGKLPAIVYCSGHSPNGFRAEAYQRIMINYAKKGFAVLAFDPIGQGERIQYLKSDGKPRFGPTHEHSYPGSLSFVSGLSPANYFIWDGIRAVDYLISRNDIDPTRIGIAGRSGGGTQSAYIAAMDDRILAAAPECYLTTFDKLLRSQGPQDAEQVFFHGIARGYDHADLLEVRAPKPALMVTTTNDMFPIEGAREVYREVSRAYAALGSKQNIQMVEDDAPHASTKKNREASYAFFQKYLNQPGNAQEEDVKLFTDEELHVTPGGNVYASLKGENLYTLIAKQTAGVLHRKKGEVSLEALQKKVIQINQYKSPAAVPEVIFSGRVVREGYDIEKYMIKSTGDHYLPILWMKPRRPSLGAVLLLDEKGKQEAAAIGGLADKLVTEGHEVILPDLAGIGELVNAALPGGDAQIERVALNLWYLGILADKSLVALRMEEIKRLGDFIRSKINNKQTLSLIATGVLGADALQATVISTDLFYKKILIGPLVSFESLFEKPEYRTKFLPTAPAGVLQHYDLPQLAGVQKAQSLLVIGPVSGEGVTLSQEEVQKQYAGVVEKQQIIPGESTSDTPAHIIRFLK
ncbi:hypothetical protein DYBT9275_05664 [Dyadobacter sp. CECT 9275]|uniref:Acetyl xylan esterase domain-containing protein n=1 Tax=Dyadobacter helix TaxID=2822344 RepID=A0A916JHI6_9BACT|nr:acetylxylan esterase [Dyadobacter sp. CECT 9275]CAG5016920.1 hypothetical protein DYBT9275_05664 [Dyadobacter sp. CECT 9275]